MRKKITSKPNENAVHYIDKQELKAELQKYYSSGKVKEERVISERLGEMMLLIATNYASKYNFHKYPYKVEMISDAVYRMISQIEKLNPDRNPFSYMTAICYTSFLKCMGRHELNKKRLRELQERVYLDFINSEGLPEKKLIDNDENYLNLDNEDNIEELNFNRMRSVVDGTDLEEEL